MFGAARHSFKYAFFKKHHYIIKRNIGGSLFTNNHAWKIDSDVEKSIIDETLLPKHHPGRCNHVANLPKTVSNGMQILMEGYAKDQAVADAEKFANHLWTKKQPIEKAEATHVADQMLENMLIQTGKDLAKLEESDKDNLISSLEKKVRKKLKQCLYHWRPIEFDAYKSFLYLMTRSIHDFNILHKILSELKQRDSSFYPDKIFDFGSGTGTVAWAVNSIWGNDMTEIYCVDRSTDMHSLAQLILQGGKEQVSLCISNIYFRSFLPNSGDGTYNLVTSAFSLLELPDQNARLSHLLYLWRKTKDYLILVENGTYAGYTTILEARDFILQLSDNNQIRKNSSDDLSAHVFSPCPHDKPCPRFDASLDKKIPCNFPISYRDSQTPKEKKIDSKYSYVILRKGKRNNDYVWPRLLTEVVTPSKRAYCRMCTAEGKSEEAVITAKKHGKVLFQCAKASKWGDRFPVFSSKPISDETTIEESSPSKISESPESVIGHDFDNIEETIDREVIGNRTSLARGRRGTLRRRRL